MKKLLMLFVFGHMLAQNTYGQGVAIGTTAANPAPSAMLDVSSNNKGVLIPRMTLTERNAIPSPANSLLIYQTDSATRGYYQYDSLTTSWLKFATYPAGQNPIGNCLSVIPQPAFPLQSLNYINMNSNTTASLGQIVIPFGITLNEVTILGHFNGGTPGRIKIGLYSENGQTKIFESISDSMSSITIVPMTTVLSSPKVINPGIYYLAVITMNTTSITLAKYYNITAADLLVNQPGRSVLQGTLLVPINTLPAIIDPTAISYIQGGCVLVKFN